MKHAALVLAVLLAAACSPQVYPLYLEVRKPSASGLDLSRKSMTIVYVNGADSAFNRSVASEMARRLDADYFGGAENVSLFSVPPSDSVSLEDMHALVMDTEKDVVFLLSAKQGPQTSEGKRAVSARLLVYDSLGEDKIHVYSGLAESVDADEVGQRISKRFLSKWKTESYSFYYFDDLNMGDWLDALDRVEEGKLAKAIDIWSVLVKQGSGIKQACAAYNIAQTFYLMEDFEMATRWLDEAEKLENLSLAPGLRKRIARNLEK